jgi:ribosomal protein S18 acetylase RimI-like enzyme
MADQTSGAAEDPVDAEPRLGLGDAEMLEEAMRRAISTSPEAFLTTIDDLDDKETDHWEREISSSTWAVIQTGDKIVGFAVARWPDREMDRDVDPVAARFIESVWIDPKLRGKRLAERLVRFLFEVERAKSPSVRRFLLWVFDKNHKAIRLYERMGFRYVARQNLADRSGRAELRYEYLLEPDARRVQAAPAGRRDDLREGRLVYRVLGEGAG